MVKTMRVYDAVCERSKWQVNMVLSVIAPILYYLICLDVDWDKYMDIVDYLKPMHWLTSDREIAIKLILYSTIASILVTFILLLYSNCSNKKGNPLALLRYGYWSVPFAIVCFPVIFSNTLAMAWLIVIFSAFNFFFALEESDMDYGIEEGMLRAALSSLSFIGILCTVYTLAIEITSVILGNGCIKNTMEIFF